MGERSELKNWSETDYRKSVQEIFKKIVSRFETIDPDVAECEQSFGVLTILFPNRTKMIFSTQPSVRQIWVAIAFQGRAVHFDFDHQSCEWRDDKNQGVELMGLLRETMKQVTGIEL